MTATTIFNQARIAWSIRGTGINEYGGWFNISNYENLKIFSEKSNRIWYGVIDHWIERRWFNGTVEFLEVQLN